MNLNLPINLLTNDGKIHPSFVNKETPINETDPPVRFVYKPRLKDRVFCEYASDRIHIYKWSNGCRHVVGGVHLSYETSFQGHWWRAKAIAIAEEIVREHSGIGYDIRGEIHLILPHYAVKFAHYLMGDAARSVNYPDFQDREASAHVMKWADQFPDVFLGDYLIPRYLEGEPEFLGIDSGAYERVYTIYPVLDSKTSKPYENTYSIISPSREYRFSELHMEAYC